MRPKPGDVINGKYRVIRLIGDGGMGAVFEARHEFLGMAVALKFLHPELARRPGLVARFLQEARLAASIRSPHIAHVTDVDQASDGSAYLVMELLQGESLQNLLDREHRLSRDTALDFTLQILAGLQAAHSIGAVHRDLKPDNVFVTPSPHGPFLKILDFGIAKLRVSREFQVGLTRPGVVMGTPEYMAPEQAFSADTVDARADIFSVGIMLFEMLAGRRPLDGDDARDIATRVMANQVLQLRQLDPSIPEPLSQVVHRAMASEVAKRFASAAELRDVLTPFCGALSLGGKLAATPMPPAVHLGGAPAPAPGTPSSNRPAPSPRAEAASMAVSVMSPTTPKVSTGTHPDPPDVDPRATTAPMNRLELAGPGPQRMVAPAAGVGLQTQQAPAYVSPKSGTAAMPMQPNAGAGAMPMQPKSGTAAMPMQPNAGAGAMPMQPKSGTAAMPMQSPYSPAAYPPAAYPPAAYPPAGHAPAGHPFAPATSPEPASYLQSSTPGVAQPTRPARTRAPAGLSAGVLIALVAVAGLIVAVAIMAVRSSSGSGGASEWPTSPSPGTAATTVVPPAPTPTGNANPLAATNPAAIIPPPSQPLAQAPSAPTHHATSTTSNKPPVKPPESGSGHDAGVVFPPFTIPFPSTLPPSFPSALPPLPTVLPTILPFPIPGLPGIQPAPSASR